MATIIVEPPSLVIPVIEEPLPIVVLCIAISSLMVAKTHASIIYGDIKTTTWLVSFQELREGGKQS